MNDYIPPQCKIERTIYENCYLYNFYRYAEQNNIDYKHLTTGIDNIFNIYILKNTTKELIKQQRQDKVLKIKFLTRYNKLTSYPKMNSKTNLTKN
jgi:hypothetical protein